MDVVFLNIRGLKNESVDDVIPALAHTEYHTGTRKYTISDTFIN